MIKKLLIIVLVFIGIYIVYFAVKTADFYKNIYQNGNSTAIKAKTEYNILLLGYGGIDANGNPHDGPFLTDSLIVAHVDVKKNTVSLISLPRDIWVKVPTKSGDDFHSKINSLYNISRNPTNYPDVDLKKPGTPELLERAIHTVTGLTIDNYVSVDFSGFEKAIDSLGGVDVQVQKTFDDYEYPIDGKEKELCGRDADFALIEKFLKPGADEAEKQQLFKDKSDLEKFFKDITDDPKTAFPCRYEHLHFDAGLVHMDGKTALKYVRSRHSLQDGTDFGRGARQQQFVRAVKNRLISVGILARVFPLMDEVGTHLQTNISIQEMKNILADVPDATKYRFIDIRMSDTDYLKVSFSDYGGYILIPRTGQDNWKEIQTMISNGINEIKSTPKPNSTGTIVPTRVK